MDATDLYAGLNPEQMQAVRHTSGPVLVIAGAGTGKTRVITTRIARLIAEGLADPDQILALTFTDKAAREMEERVDVLLPLGIVSVNITTFNSFGDQLLAQYGVEMGMPAGLIVANRAQQIFFLREHFDELKLDYFAPWANPSSQLGAILDFFSKLRNELIDAPAYQKYADSLKAGAKDEADRLELAKHLELARVYGIYTQLKKEHGLIDYDDQINLSIELLRLRPNVLRKVREQYKFILVDEFQDTNYAQNQLLELLAGDNGNLMVVGDDDQSIYKFRGAAVSNILAFQERFSKAQQIVLTKNYRSTQQILDASYQLITHNNPDRLEAKYGISKRLTSKAQGDEPIFISQPDYPSEAQAVAVDIAAQLEAGVEPKEIAVLIRKRRQAADITAALQVVGVPYRYIDTQELHKRPEIEQLLYFIQYIADPSSSQQLYHLLESTIFNVDIHFLTLCSAIARRTNQPLDAVLREDIQDKDISQRVMQGLELLDSLREAARNHTARELTYQFLKRSGHLGRLEEQAETNPAIQLTFENYQRFFEALAAYQDVASDKSIYGFCRSFRDSHDLAGIMAAGEVDTSSNEVQVLTIHQSKGLEFDSVYIFDTNQESIPGRRKPEGIAVPDELLPHEVLPSGDWHIQEERRLMYVAMTRAKRRLALSFSPQHGGKRLRKPSIFLTEIFGDISSQIKAADEVPVLLQLARNDLPKPISQLIESRLFQDGKLHLTPHQIDDYLTCPYNFRYRHILQVPQEPSPAAMYGTLIHTAINEYYARRQAGHAVELGELLELVPRLWRPEGFESSGDEQRRRHQAEATIKSFYAREQAADSLPTLVEKSFSVELPEFDLVVRGRIDALYEQSDGVEIRDFKTSQVEDADKATKKARSSEQLAIYAVAWERMTGNVPKQLILDFVDTGLVGVTQKTAKDLQKTLEKIGEVARGIRAGEFPRGNCMFCEHRTLAVDNELAHA